MKTSNKLLVGFLALVLAGVAILVISAKVSFNKNTIEGNRKKIVVNRALESFDKIHVKGKMTLILTQGLNPQLKISADENLIPLIESMVEDGELTIRLKGKIKRNNKLSLYLTVGPNTKEMDFSAGITVETPEGLSGEKLKVETSSGANARLKLQYAELFTEVSSGGDLTLLGISNMASFIFSSGGNIHAEDLLVEKATAKGSSGGNAHINVAKELRVEVSSGANLNYSGNAVIANMNQSSGGNIHKN